MVACVMQSVRAAPAVARLPCRRAGRLVVRAATALPAEVGWRSDAAQCTWPCVSAAARLFQTLVYGWHAQDSPWAHSLIPRCTCMKRLLAAQSSHCAAAAALQVKTVTPVGDRLFVKAEEAEATTVGGILLPSSAQKRPTQGTVQSAGSAKGVKVRGARRQAPQPALARLLRLTAALGASFPPCSLATRWCTPSTPAPSWSCRETTMCCSRCGPQGSGRKVLDGPWRRQGVTGSSAPAAAMPGLRFWRCVVGQRQGGEKQLRHGPAASRQPGRRSIGCGTSSRLCPAFCCQSYSLWHPFGTPHGAGGRCDWPAAWQR